MKIYVLIQVEQEIHETTGCECGCGEGWETNYETHCSVIKVSTNRQKLEKIKFDAEKYNKKTNKFNEKMLVQYNVLVQTENVRINVLYTEQTVKYRGLFVEYKATVNEKLTLIGKELYPKELSTKYDWFEKAYCDLAYYNPFYKHQFKIIRDEFFKRFPNLKLNDKDFRDLTERDLKGYQNFEKKLFQMPVMKLLITPYQIIEKELEN